MYIVNREQLDQCRIRHARSRKSIDLWIKHVQGSQWRTPHDVKQSFQTVSILTSGRAIFNLGGNHFRVITKIFYVTQIVQIRFAGSHAEYDRVDAEII